jgi:hypothetical protein
MRIKSLLSMLLFTMCAARAQNSDFAFLLGVSGPNGKVVSGANGFVNGSVGVNGQFNFAWQVLQRSADLYVELPLIINARDAGTVASGTVTSSDGLDFFFTPGLRLKFSPQSRVAFYGEAGGGLASFGTAEVSVARAVTVATGRATTAAFDFGGGLDFRLTRLLSFRFDARDIVTRTGLGGSNGRHHGIFAFGVAFHF